MFNSALIVDKGLVFCCSILIMCHVYLQSDYARVQKQKGRNFFVLKNALVRLYLSFKYSTL